jgi:beta-glucosidase-like glycosyl hydrolase/CubicO group peptidase (beta-lactamase class C family)
VDVNSNPKNPVINTRSFGEDRVNVANKGIAYMKGLQSRNVLGSAKHFPGHGDTDVDSHLELPTINHSRKHIDSIDLFPFKMVVKNDIWSVMVGHLNIPAMEESGYPSSVSKYVVDTLLKRDLKFKGMVFTDGLEMNAFAKYGSNGEMELRALQAGVDNLLLPVNTEKTIETIAKAVRSGELSEQIINEKCRKILQTKYDLGILKQAPIVSSENLLDDLNTDEISQLNKKIYSNAITILENKNAVLPINKEKYKRIANINIGDTTPNKFQNIVSKYSSSTTFNLSRDFSETLIDSIVQLFSKDDLLIVSITNTNINAGKNYGVTPQTIRLIEKLATLDNSMVLTIFASPYVLSSFSRNLEVDGLLMAYQEQPEALEIAARGIFGKAELKGRLPVSVSKYPNFSGLILTSPNSHLVPRLKQESVSQKYLPNVVGRPISIKKKPQPKPIVGHPIKWEKSRFSTINERLQKAIADTVFPGCQVLVAQNGQIIYNKAFGTHTYDNLQKVKLSDIYDIASVTKIAATTLALMKLHDEGKFKLDDKLSAHLTYLKRTNKSGITIRQVLAHQAGLQPSITTFKNQDLFSTTKDSNFSIQVANGFYTSETALDQLHNDIVKSPLIPKKPYRYSDLGFYFMAELVHELSGQTVDKYVTEHFYDPLELCHTTFNPTQIIPLSQIIPTENDTVFRKQLVHGFVHDPTVAMLGGVGGSAGLFSNSQDLVVIMQLLLNRGEYNNQRYISAETVDLFTQPIIENNRRGAGFDKPAEDTTNSPACPSASPKSFGHSGFTGSLVWADPENQLVYIFLSNRVNPTATNDKLLKQNIRTEIMQMFYDVLRRRGF